ncbi:MAG: hypothetical protein H6649_14265 [Caldilineae bacterium]|nr:hypothetical protein [Anaerolineae bacterium]MCB9155204.1 hypothetical protein [Caldilineae bacterium]
MNWTPQSTEEKRDEARRTAQYSKGAVPASYQLPAAFDSQTLHKELRTWSLTLVFWGVISLAVSGLDSAWGVLLLLVAAMAFVFKDAAMFVVFGVTLAWAGLSNLATMEGSGIVFGLIQAGLAVQIFRKYRYFRAADNQAPAQPEYSDEQPVAPASRAARVFPPLGCLFSVLAAAGALAFLVAVIVLVIQEIPFEITTGVALAIGLVIDLAVLGLAVGLAALVARFRWRGLSILALIVSALILLGWLAMIVTAPPA